MALRIAVTNEFHTSDTLYVPATCLLYECSMNGATDKDPKTKKNWWYTCGQTHKTRLEVPDDWKLDFASKQLTCGLCPVGMSTAQPTKTSCSPVL